MEWLQIIAQFGLTGVLSIIGQKLWAKCEAQQVEIARLNEATRLEVSRMTEARLSELRQIARLPD